MTEHGRTKAVRIIRDPNCFQPYTRPLEGLRRRVTKMLGRPEDSTDEHPDRILGPCILVEVSSDNTHRITADGIARSAARDFRQGEGGCLKCPAYTLKREGPHEVRICGGIYESYAVAFGNYGGVFCFRFYGPVPSLSPSRAELHVLRESHCYTLPAK